VAEGADVGEVKFVVWQARESVLRPEDRRWLISVHSLVTSADLEARTGIEGDR